MNYIKVINKAEILLYSTLIDIMSGINQLKTRKQTTLAGPVAESADDRIVMENSFNVSTVSKRLGSWDSIQQTILSLLLWTVLGLAAGFLLGMLKHG